MNLKFFYQNRHKFNSFELFLANLPPNIQPSVIKSIFSRWADVDKVTIKSRDLDSWTAQVKFSSFFGMIKAYEKYSFNNQRSYKVKIDGYNLKVKPSRYCLNKSRLDFRFRNQKEIQFTKKINKQTLLPLKMNKTQQGVEKNLSQRRLSINPKGRSNGSIQQAKNIRKVRQEGVCKNKTEQNQESKQEFTNKKYKLQNSKALLNHSQFLSYVADFYLFDEEQKLDTTTYEDKSQLIKSQEEPFFVQINPSKSDVWVLLSLEEKRRLQKLQQSNFFSDFNDENGEIVKIGKTLKINFNI